MVCQKAITICRGLSHLTRSLSRIDCREQRSPKDRKGTLRPDFQASSTVDQGFFLKPMSPQDIGRQLCRNPGIVSLKVHKREKFFVSDFEFFTILYLVKLKYKGFVKKIF